MDRTRAALHRARKEGRRRPVPQESSSPPNSVPPRPPLSGTAMGFHPLQKIAYFDICIAVVAVPDLSAFPEERIRLIEEKDDAALFCGPDQAFQIFFGFTNVFANELLQSNSRSSNVPTQDMTPKPLRMACGFEIGFTRNNFLIEGEQVGCFGYRFRER